MSMFFHTQSEALTKAHKFALENAAIGVLAQPFMSLMSLVLFLTRNIIDWNLANGILVLLFLLFVFYRFGKSIQIVILQCIKHEEWCISKVSVVNILALNLPIMYIAIQYLYQFLYLLS
jgi:hypothetical protein